jgi:hypothetical protein
MEGAFCLSVVGAMIFTGPLRVLILSVLAIPLLFAVIGIGAFAHLLVRWVLPHRPVIIFDSEGAEFPVVSCTLPWPELMEIRLFPVRQVQRRSRGGSGRTGSRDKTMMAFVPAHPADLLAGLQLNRIRRLSCGRGLRLFGSPITIADLMLSHAAEEIAGFAGRFAPVPVRRYGRSTPPGNARQQQHPGA